MTAREEPVVPVVLWRRVIRSNASWMDGTHRWVEHPRTGTDGMERFFAYPVALDPVPTLVADLAALRAERDALRARVDAADAERDEVLKVADVATDAAAKAVLDAKEVYEVRHLETIRRLKALLGEARPMVYIKANEFSEHEDVTLERQSVLARIDKEIAS